MSRLSTLTDNQPIGQRLAALRDRTRLSQAEFAERLGISPRAYQNYERGDREIPAVVLKLLYEVFSVDPLWVLIGPGLDPRGTDQIPHADLLEDIVVAVETRLQRSRKQLVPAKKARLIKLLYLQFHDKARIDPEHVNELLALTA